MQISQIEMKAAAIINNYTTVFSISCGAICAIAAAEMAIHLVGDVLKAGGIIRQPGEEGGRSQVYPHREVTTNISANLAGVLFYGLCAGQVIPYSYVLGATAFVIYSLFKGEKPGAYVTSKLVHQFVTECILPFMENVFNNLISPLVKGVLRFFSLQVHPTWYGVALLATVYLFRASLGLG